MLKTQPQDFGCICGSDECVPKPSKTPITDDAVIYLEAGETILGCDSDGYVPSCVSRSLELELKSAKDWNTTCDKSLNQLADELFQQEKEIESQKSKIASLRKELEEVKEENENETDNNFWLSVGLLIAALCFLSFGHIFSALILIAFMLAF